MSRCEHPAITKAREEIYEAVRFLSPDQVHQLFKDLAEDTKKLADNYDKQLQDAIL